MNLAEPSIPYYSEINEFLASITQSYKTNNPNFFCLKLEENDLEIANCKAPFRKNFFFMALITNAGKTQITYDTTKTTALNSFLVFQSPGLLYSFYRDAQAKGYLIYFKKECFSFFKPDFDKEFPFFNLLHTNFFKLNQQKYEEFAPDFEDVFIAYKQSPDQHHKIAAIKLLALLYQLKEFVKAFNEWQESFITPQQILLQKFLRLVNNFYLEKRSIEQYAEILHISPNHLTKSVKIASNKTPLSFVHERIISEAKSLIQFSNVDIAQIAYQLNFSDPANFGKFFKKHVGCSPLEFRKKFLNE